MNYIINVSVCLSILMPSIFYHLLDRNVCNVSLECTFSHSHFRMKVFVLNSIQIQKLPLHVRLVFAVCVFFCIHKLQLNPTPVKHSLWLPTVLLSGYVWALNGWYMVTLCSALVTDASQPLLTNTSICLSILHNEDWAPRDKDIRLTGILCLV